MRSGFLLLLAIFGISILFAKENKTYNYQGWDLIKNEQLVVSFKLPLGWKSQVSNEPDQIIYFKGEKADSLISDSSAKVVTIDSYPTIDSFEKIVEKRVNNIKNKEGGKIFVEATDGKIGNIKAKVIRYASKIDGTQRVSDNVVLVHQNRLYGITYTVTNESVEHDKELKNQILASFNFDMMRPSAVMNLEKPKEWFEFKDNDYAQAFSKKENGSKNPGEGIIKIKTVKIDEEKSLQQFAMEFVSSVTKEGGKSSGFSTTSPINGHKLMWFDVLDKEDAFKERYHIAKDGYTFYIIYFISSKELFEKELKAVLAESLLTFKLLPPK